MSGNLLAQSVSGPVQLAPSADCEAKADVLWSFTYTTNPTREAGLVTNADGALVADFDKPSTLTGGVYNATWETTIEFPQPEGTVIGTYGRAGGSPPTASDTVEFFVLYNCTTKRVLYRCSGNYGSCPTTAPAAIALFSEPVPALSPASLAALGLALLGVGAGALRRAAPVSRQRSSGRHARS
jgi:hypothetical protein